MKTDVASPSYGTLGTLPVCMALLWTGFAMFLPLFALRFESFGAGIQALSTSDMAYALSFALAAPPAGMLADRIGRRPVVLASLAGYMLVFFGYFLAASSGALILLRGLAGVFSAGVLPTAVSIVGDAAPRDRRARWIGIVHGGAASGYIIGPPLGGLLYERFGYGAASAAAIAMAAGALLLAVYRIRETYAPAAHPRRPQSSWKQEWRALAARSTLLLAMGVTFGVMLAYAFVQPQFMFYAYDHLSWTSSQLGLVLSAYGAAFTLGAFALGQLSDRVGRKPVLVLGLALFSVQFIGLLVFHQASWIALSFIIAGMGNAIYNPALSAILLDLAPPEHTASLLGLNSTASSLGGILGPASVVLLGSFLHAQMGFLIATAVVATLALASALALHTPRPARAALQP